MTSAEKEDLERQLRQEAQKESAEQLAQILPRLEAMQRAKLAQETFETLRAKARAKLNATLEAKKKGALEKVCKDLPKEAKEQAQAQWQLASLFEAVQRGLQTEEEAKDFLRVFEFARACFFQLQTELTRALLAYENAAKKAREGNLEGALELLPKVAKKLGLVSEKMATALEVLGKPKAWKGARGLSPAEREKLFAEWQETLLPKMRRDLEEDNF